MMVMIPMTILMMMMTMMIANDIDLMTILMMTMTTIKVGDNMRAQLVRDLHNYDPRVNNEYQFLIGIFIMMVKMVIIVFSITRLRAAVWSLLGTQPSKDCTVVALKRPRYLIIIVISTASRKVLHT